jgi:hypothetical protein
MLALLACLTLLKVVAAIALCPRGPRGRGEQAVEIGVAWTALVIGPIYALGLANLLTRWNLAIISTAVDAAAIALSLNWPRRREPRDFLLDLGQVFRTPWDALVVSLRSRSLLAVGIVVFYGLIAWMTLQAYLAPNYTDWDALWYHDPMIAFAIQNHGFRMVPLTTHLQTINGFQKVCEMTQLWFGIFVGRRLVDVTNIVTLPLMIAAMFAFARRFKADVATAIGWGVALALMPANVRLLQSTLVDPQAAGLLLAAAYFTTRPELALRPACFAIIALTLAVGAKTYFLVPVFFLSVILLVRLVRARRTLGGRTTALLIAGGTFSLLAMISFTHLRNWIHFGNPFWPVLSYDNEALNIHWKGWFKMRSENDDLLTSVDRTLPVGTLLDYMTAKPYSVNDRHAWQVNDFGWGILWIVLPIGVLATFAALGKWLVGKIRRKPDPSRPLVGNAALLGVVALITFFSSTAHYIGRYHVAWMGMLIAVIVWLSSRTNAQRISDAAVVLVQLSGVTMAWWASPHWFVGFTTMVHMLRTPATVRECTPEFGAPVWMDTCLAREREVGDGTIVAFVTMHFVGLLFNNDYSNKVVWLQDEHDPLGEAERIGAQWVYTEPGQPLAIQLSTSNRWKLIGPLEAQRFGSVYRRSAP